MKLFFTDTIILLFQLHNYLEDLNENMRKCNIIFRFFLPLFFSLFQFLLLLLFFFPNFLMVALTSISQYNCSLIVLIFFFRFLAGCADSCLKFLVSIHYLNSLTYILTYYMFQLHNCIATIFMI